jgi:hypothetical protein
MTQTNTHSPQRSTFINVLAWIFIVLAGFATAISVLQNLMLMTMGVFDKLPEPSGPEAEGIPAFALFMFSHMRLFFFSFLLVSAVTLASAIGLLHRKNWARLVFVGILGLGIAWNLVGLVFEQVMFSSMGRPPSNAPPGFDSEFETMMTMMRIFSFVFILAITSLFGWLIRRLMSEPVRAEFGVAALSLTDAHGGQGA